MQNSVTLQGDKFIKIVKEIERLTSSQQKFIHNMMSQQRQINKSAGEQILRKSFGLWADRSDLADSQEFVNNLRNG